MMKRICLFVCAICALNIINAQQREKYEFMRNLPVVCFDYAAECGEQDLIDTTPFKSHLRVAFIFHISFETHD